jgi:hypothetical protein
MNRTTTVIVALIVAAGLSTMVYAVPAQLALAHHLLSPDPSDVTDADVIPFGANSPDPSSKSDPPAVGSNSADPPSSGTGPPLKQNCVDCITTQMLSDGAVTNPKIALHSVNQTQLAFVQEYVTFNSCGGTNGNHNVQCSIHIEGTSASSLTCTVANPAISGGDNTGDCQTDTGLHLSCVIPPTPGPFLCLRLS